MLQMEIREAEIDIGNTKESVEDQFDKKDRLVGNNEAHSKELEQEKDELKLLNNELTKARQDLK